MQARIIGLALTVLLTVGAAAQSAAAPGAMRLDAATREALVKVGGQLMLSGRAYEYDRTLADEIGPRLTGSANYAKAADWALAEFMRLGLKNVHEEAWEIASAWEPATAASGQILSPHPARLHLESDGWSPSTPPGGIRGNVYHLKQLTGDGVKAEGGQIKDTVVLVDRDSFPKGDLLFGKTLDAIRLIAEEGAKGVLLGVGGGDNASVMYGLTCCNGAISPIPTGNVGREDTLLLRRYLELGPVEVQFSFTNTTREHAKVNNVVAEIPGTDANGEYVLIGGHLDSWHLGTGAQDNGTGAASVLAIAEAVKSSGVQPRRTMRFVLFGGEEEGLLGSVQYARAHEGEMDKCAGVFVTDSGAEPPKGWFVFGREDEQQALAELKPLLSGLGADGTSDEGEFTFETDEAPFLVQGAPSFVLWTPMNEYFKIHHKTSDTFDKVNQRDLNLGAAVVGITALRFADAQERLKHFSASERDEQLKKIKQFDSYQDMASHKML